MILFSPVGTADPLTILGDGPMLHIVRHYTPEKIYLYLSPQITEYENADKRYSQAIALLSSAQGRKLPEIICIQSQLDQVHRYDLCIEEIQSTLQAIAKDNPDENIIANVTSGTPAMQQALVAIHAFGRFDLRAVQVVTPKKDMNDPGDREIPAKYDLQTLWEMNRDNNDGQENRCHEVDSANFCDLILRDNVRVLVNSYDYSAALQLARQCQSISPEAVRLIEGCVYRMRLDSQRALPFFKGSGFSYDPAQRMPEYLAMLEVYLEREQWADYLRALTPALYETLLEKVRKNISDSRWMKKNAHDRTTIRIDGSKVARDPELHSIWPRITSEDAPFASNGYLEKVVEHFSTPSDCIPFNRLRTMEEKARHPLAHEITKVNKESIEKISGTSMRESLDTLFELNNAKPGLYAQINSDILHLL